MKTLILLVSTLGSVALAAKPVGRIPANTSEISVSCSSPKNFAGLSASVSGKLKLSELPNGASRAEGQLKVELNNPRDPWSGEIKALGQYDDLTSVGSDHYFHGGAGVKNARDLMDIYVNYSRPDVSFVTYDGSTYKMVCK